MSLLTRTSSLEESALVARFRELVERNAEGHYWDYKREHQATPADLIHDVLCMANAQHSGDRYILYGVDESGAKATIRSITGTPKRRKQADIIDILHTASYYEGRAPEVVLRTFKVDGIEVEMLVISDRPMKPYVLAQNTRKGEGEFVRAHHIYTRIGDRNTPKNEAAPPPLIEWMWRERFGLNMEPRMRMVHLLQTMEWDKDLGNRSTAFHRTFADYRIEFGDWKRIERHEVFSYFFIGQDTYLQNARFMYNSTELFCLRLIICDGGRIELPEPETRVLSVHGEQFAYNCYFRDSDRGALLHFLTNGTFDFRDGRGGEGQFILFNDKTDATAFEAEISTKVSTDELKAWKDDKKSIQKQIVDAGWNRSWHAGVIAALRQRHDAWAKGPDTRSG